MQTWIENYSTLEDNKKLDYGRKVSGLILGKISICREKKMIEVYSKNVNLDIKLKDSKKDELAVVLMNYNDMIENISFLVTKVGNSSQKGTKKCRTGSSIVKS